MSAALAPQTAGSTPVAVPARLTAAFAELLAALQEAGAAVHRPDLQQTPQRAAALWHDHLLAGERMQPAELLAAPMPHGGRAPVLLRRVGVHLVCPHHLTVAWGHVDLPDRPRGHRAGAARRCDLVQACTARFVLQEEAAQQICEALVTHLGAAAAVTQVVAVHPCHTITRPHSHGATLACWGQAGDEAAAVRLQAQLLTPEAAPANAP